MFYTLFLWNEKTLFFYLLRTAISTFESDIKAFLFTSNSVIKSVDSNITRDAPSCANKNPDCIMKIILLKINEVLLSWIVTYLRVSIKRSINIAKKLTAELKPAPMRPIVGIKIKLEMRETIPA